MSTGQVIVAAAGEIAFETRDFYLACYLRCAGYELRPPRVERGFVLLLLYEPIYEPKVEGNQK